jgi:uncharacterized protein (TIGR00369 family)
VNASNPSFEEVVRESFGRQRAMGLLGASLTRVEPGAVDIAMPYREDLTQQNGFVHAGVVTAIADSACGYAAYTLMPAGSDVLSVEFKVNLLSPAAGESFLAEARVVRSGRTLTVVHCEVFALRGEARKLIALMVATMIRVERG